MKTVENLEEEISHHKALYYQGRPQISDSEYDQLEEKLRELAPNSHVLLMVGSDQVGGKKISHNTKMLSLNKTYSLTELEGWMGENSVVSMFKIDGVSCSLIYDSGKLQVAKTRGNGSFGENILAKAKWIGTIPKIIKAQEHLEIRGEIFCGYDDFYDLAQEMEEIKLERPTNPRNIVAGLISRKDNIELNRYLRFTAFDCLGGADFKLESEKFSFLKSEKFSIPKIVLHKNFKSLPKVITQAEKFMEDGEYLIDGLVFSMSDLSKHREMGATAHHPRYKMAFKFKGEVKQSVLTAINWSVSRNGILTPVGSVQPIEISGAMIERVTLHNLGIVRDNNLKVGDTIEIVRSGEVIPKFMRVVASSVNSIDIPKNCPSCKKALAIEDIRLICSNRACPAQIKKSILNFIQKIGIDDISSKRLEEMLKVKLIKEIPDLYNLKIEDFLTLDKVKEKLANKFFQSIQNSKQTDLAVFLSALGLTGGAYNKCEKIVNAGYDTIEKINNLNQEQLVAIDSFAEKSAGELLTSLASKQKIISKLLKTGFHFAEKRGKDSSLEEKKICITGALSVKRSVVEDKVRSLGGSIVSSVSKNTDYLLTNENDSKSNKFKKAKELGIKIISEIDLNSL